MPVFITLLLFCRPDFDSKIGTSRALLKSTLYFDFNDTFTTQNIADKTGYAFTHWEINGNRTEIPKTSVSLQVSASIIQNTMAIAHYVDINQDSDNDGIKDRYEIRT